MGAVAIKMMPKIEQAIQTDKDVVLDGLYSWEEYTTLKEKFPNLLLLCVYASPAIRYERLSSRKERTFTKAEARVRDISELQHLNVLSFLEDNQIGRAHV